MANVLVISMHYWPEGSGNAPYSTGLAEHLAKRQNQVTVLAGMPHYPEWRVHDGYGGWSRAESHDGVRIHRRGHYIPSRQTAVRRAVYEATFVAAGLPEALTARADIVLGVVPSLGGGVLARLAAARAHAGYGVIFQDLMGSAADQSGIQGGRWAGEAARRLERWVVSRAAAVAPVTEAFVPYLRQIGVPSDRIEILRNWTNLGMATRNREETRRELGWAPNEWVVLHAGNMGLKQGLEQVVAAARAADEGSAPVRFVLMGDGNQRQSIQDLAEGTRRLSFRPFVDVAELPNVLAAADVLLVSERESVVDMSLPSKLTSYFASGRPVVAAVHPDGATARELDRAGAGIVAPAGQPGALLDAIIGLRSTPQHAERMGKRGLKYAEANLGRVEALERVDAFVARVAGQTATIRAVKP
jgi:colanic acid biosynthesis glycosyl transferase WcaI